MASLMLAVEFGTFLIFMACLIHAFKKGKKYVFLLFIVFLYSILFENLNMMLSANKPAGYYYSQGFHLFIGDLPIFVAFSWASLIYSAYFLTNSLGVKESSKPFVDALLVLLVDLAIDVFAIRFGFWYWRGYSFHEGWFGVPANNYMGWFLVTFFFSLMYRKLTSAKMNERLRYPLLVFSTFGAYLLVFLAFALIEPVSSYLTKSYEMLLVVLLALLSLLFIRKGGKPKTSENIDWLVRVPFYLFGFYGLINFYGEGVLFTMAFLSLVFVEVLVILRSRIKR
ncbi:hypothetical protein A3K63_01170 [Candidatus Micrarchaeota archaeon RBG_16_49_10]|nr:MAG: hypothetical protein A3K63_01170 [Candidatus Micrarchaeota archaeon RBG_16_49_10]